MKKPVKRKVDAYSNKLDAMTFYELIREFEFRVFMDARTQAEIVKIEIMKRWEKK